MRRPKGLSSRLDRHANCMVVVHAAYAAATLLAATFLPIFLWRASHDLAQIALFCGLTSVTIPVAFVANGVVLRRIGAGTSIRIGLLALGLVYAAVLTLGPASTAWIVPQPAAGAG